MSRLGSLPLLFVLIVDSWAQPSLPVTVAPPATVTAEGLEAQREAATNAAMAASATVAMANITGVPTFAPEAANMVTAVTSLSPIMVGGIGTPVITTSFQPSNGAGDVQECKVLAGTVGKVMQGLLFLCCCMALVFKYRREAGDRTPTEFLMDSTKQLVGAGWIHVLNLCFAKSLEARYEAGDQCSWYWLQIVLDCTLGVAIEYVLMLMLTACVQKAYPSQAEDFETGDYKSPDGSIQPVRYMKQLVMWLLIVSLMKVCIVLIMSGGRESLSSIAKAVLSPFAYDATVKLFVVMIFTPICMNVFQFWMVDNFIKKKGDGSGMDASMGDMELDGSMRTRIQHGDL